MDMDAAQYSWAHDAFLTLHGPMDSSCLNPGVEGDKWPSFTTTTMIPKLPAGASVERHGQITPPEEPSFSPREQQRRDSVVPGQVTATEQQAAAAELPWPFVHPLHALHNFHPTQEQEQEQEQERSPRTQPQPTEAPRRRRAAAKQAPAPPAPMPDHTTAAPDPQPPKRKRGRPKSQPQPQVEGYGPEGFPFPISTARQSHLEKNRVAAHKCRQRRKEYIDSLEARGREASSKNKLLKEHVALLRDEVLALKNEVLRHAGCNFWAVDEYLARCAGDLLGMDGPSSKRRKHSSAISPSIKPQDDFNTKHDRSTSITSLPSQDTSNSPDDFDDYFIDNLDGDM